MFSDLPLYKESKKVSRIEKKKGTLGSPNYCTICCLNGRKYPWRDWHKEKICFLLSWLQSFCIKLKSSHSSTFNLTESTVWFSVSPCILHHHASGYSYWIRSCMQVGLGCCFCFGFFIDSLICCIVWGWNCQASLHTSRENRDGKDLPSPWSWSFLLCY